ncbi:unnamed protein product [Rotaria socialis]|uniref:Dynein regulatory complex subunit 3 n=1 Tax=Rotaria socialis TaxID=392032 RepID=A0A817U1S4_9BILA|nr:unnamed protein product [Rotaria socialis]CAF3324566.1 unnamed protein product [Rotaria socialis]CAF3325969.1 unnamed protein product [Rotaria socialis]CAF3411945.1 unnamed protein product [Rotaria socialis]CAF3447517.1 unnamed protein product [Rotaria socialis]
MARLYDAIEPEVISMSMLQYAIESLRADGESLVIPKDDKLNYSEVVVLRLDFRNILRMENLWLFTNLTKLQMDNNIIERIEGLETLHKLTWLDLSFNNITRIEGLDSLTELTDLSLYNNRIEVLENMDSLKKLNVFSIGNNQVGDENSIRYLRRFDNLRTLCLRGNPFASKQDYYVYTISHLPQVHFLDYKLIDEAPREEATKKYEIQLQQLITLEEQEREKEKAVEDQSKQHRLYKDAFVENMDQNQLFSGMFKDDTEGQKLILVPGSDELMIQFEQKFNTIITSMFEFGLKEKELRDREIEDFWICVTEAKNENTRLAATIVDEFKIYRSTLFAKEDLEQQGVSPAVATEYDEALTTLRNKLMALEITLVDQLEDTIQTFERNLGEMVSNFTESMRANFSQIRELQAYFNDSIVNLCVATVERVMKGELEDEFPDDTRELFADKDTIMNACQTSDEFHRTKIDQREDEMFSRISNWLTTMMDNIHDEEEYKRNRKRIIEISRLIDYLRADIEDM